MSISLIQELVREVLQEVSAFEDYFIIRAQLKREWSLRFNNGKLEAIATAQNQGIGVQAFTPEGVTGFATTDVLSKAVVLDTVRRAVSLAKRNQTTGAIPNLEIFKAQAVQADFTKELPADFWQISLADLEDQVQQQHCSLVEELPEVSWQTSYRQLTETWIIARTDSTFVSFSMPRVVIMHQGTVNNEQSAQSFLVHRNGDHPELLKSERQDQTLKKQAMERARFTERLLAAPHLPPGHYPLIIDYGLAKGLAHEAFGHAVESDHMHESVLASEGKLKRGLRVASPGVHIIDGPLSGDWAYQPYSANGIKRQTVEIVKDGILVAGLGDVFSAHDGGMEISGAGRAESFNHLPLPRMTNIRLLVDQVLPLESTPDILEEARRVRATLEAHGELKDCHLMLIGYRGGQVNPKTGDFVFQCSGIIDVGDPQLPIYQPAIFSGQILSALKAIRFGLGETCLNAIGTCGKGGQSVSSSGGSHRYINLDRDEQVSLGGNSR